MGWKLVAEVLVGGGVLEDEGKMGEEVRGNDFLHTWVILSTIHILKVFLGQTGREVLDNDSPPTSLSPPSLSLTTPPPLSLSLLQTHIVIV